VIGCQRGDENEKTRSRTVDFTQQKKRRAEKRKHSHNEGQTHTHKDTHEITKCTGEVIYMFFIGYLYKKHVWQRQAHTPQEHEAREKKTPTSRGKKREAQGNTQSGSTMLRQGSLGPVRPGTAGAKRLKTRVARTNQVYDKC
jgi:hypothetical protein